MSNREAAELLNSIVEHIVVALSRGEDVKLPGFGVFSVKFKRARIGCNPRTGEAVPITERYIVSFRPSTKLRHRVEISHLETA